ncbi:UvrD-helicase domain-containing protein [Spiroplasma endosymbiont of Anurida maritima]|uniref:ATP-dependent helicase n=1 Tax=Spiroplasma endosymbiont of Anurida maritima TaxID=2967972 RepID=UPI0036D3E9AD
MNLDQAINTLNKQQKEAVLEVNQPVKIIAGAGSGKTRVITLKIANLIENLNIKPWRIFALTFTNKATNEMKERVKALVDNGQETFISTYHGFCFKVIWQEYEALGFEKIPEIIDTYTKLTFIRKFFKGHGWDTIKTKPRTISTYISNWKNGSDEQVDETKLYREVDRKAYATFVAYQKYLKDNNFLDYDDLLLKVDHLFSTNKVVLEKWQNKFDYILVDEFQDTNDIQYSIIKSLTANSNKITVVGDPDQTIYSWRGARVELILNFNNDFTNTKTIYLNQNYRSTQTILNASNSFIGNNKNRIKKELFSEGIVGDKINIFEAYDIDNEAEFVAEEIQNLQKDYKYKDVYVLCRTNNLTRALEDKFSINKIPYKILNNRSFYDRKIVKQTIANIAVLLKSNNTYYEIVLDEMPGIGEKSVEKIVADIQEKNISFKDYLLNNETFPITSKRSLEALSVFKEAFLKLHNQISDNNLSLYKLVEQYLHNNGFIKRAEARDSDEAGNIFEALKILSDFEETAKIANPSESNLETLNNFLDTINLDTSHLDEEEDNTVKIITIHSAKGLENKVVFIFGVCEGSFPSFYGELEEERRTMYVAATRAQEKLYISYNMGYNFQTKRNNIASSFIREFNKQYVEIVKDKSFEAIESAMKPMESSYLFKKFENRAKAKFSLDDKVEHSFFGKGRVIGFIGNDVEVEFEEDMSTRSVPSNSDILKKLLT